MSFHGCYECAKDKCECSGPDYIWQLEVENAALRDALTHIQAMAGNPDAAEGCRLIIARAKEALRTT